MSYKITHEVILDGERVKYTLEYKNIKNINIHCTPEKGIYISAPPNTDIKLIDEHLKSNAKKYLTVIEQTKQLTHGGAAPSTQQRKINISGHTIDYELNYKNVKRINLSVSADRGVRVSAPVNVKVDDIEKFMKSNGDFIIRAIEKYEQLSQTRPSAKEYINGEYILFLGNKVYLRVEKSSYNYADINGSVLTLHVTDPDSYAHRSAVTDAFLKAKCQELIPPLCRKLYPRFKAAGIEYPKEIRFRKMISCWGNCRPGRSILTFSTHLIQLPEKCIEQVICHEFTHFIHANHSKDFYTQLEKFMPDYKKYSDLTDKLQHEIIIRGTK